MQFVRPTPFTEAIEKLSGQTPIGSALNTEEWRRVPAALRENAFFSATIENVRFLQRGRDFIDDFLKGAREENGALRAGSRQQFVKELSEWAIANGMGPLDPDDAGGLRDIRSETRLSLIFNTKTQQAQDYGYWKQGQDPDVLDAFPAQRFIRAADVTTPRVIHQQNEGVVRLKTDLDFWTAMNSPEIGGFGVPWGPWGFNSGMDVEDVDREEAEQLGLLAPGARVAPVDKDFNERLQASATGLDDDMLAQLRAQFGEQIEIAGGAVKWKAYAPTTEPPKPKPITKPRPQPEPQPEPTTLDEVLEKVGIANKEVVTADDMIRLRDELKESKPVDAATVIASVQRPDKFGALTEANIRKTVQEFIDFLPPALVRQLPRLELEVKAMGANGDYTQGGRVRLGPHLTTTPSEAKRVIFHELMHWVHREGPESYRQIITQHFNARTAGESIKQLHPYGSDTRGKRDRWYEPYAGRVYGFERPGEAGLEVPTRYIEWLARPPQWMAEHWNDPDFRETMLVVLRGLF